MGWVWWSGSSLSVFGKTLTVCALDCPMAYTSFAAVVLPNFSGVSTSLPEVVMPSSLAR